MSIRPPTSEPPALPRIHDPALRQRVFTHRSLFARPTHVFEDSPDDPSPDNEVLEHLGDQVLGLVVTDLIQSMHPHLRVGPSTKMRALIVGNQTLAAVAARYKLYDHLRLHQSQSVTLRASANVRADVFESYVGGLYRDQGLPVVAAWLRELFRPYVTEAYRIIRSQQVFETPPQPLPPVPLAHLPVRSPSSSSSSSSASASASSLSLSSPGTSPSSSITPTPTTTTAIGKPIPTSIVVAPRVPPRTPTTNGNGDVPSLPGPMQGHLGLFNQRLQQENLSVEWVFADSAGEGTKATPIWVARALVGREEYGVGRGSTKKLAKNEAAKTGLRRLGIDV